MSMSQLPVRWGVAVPILNAPMGGAAGGRLAAAVSAAGGLGMVGMGSAGSAAALRTELELLGDCSRFGIGLVDWVMRREPDLWTAVLDAGPLAISVSFGEDLGWVRDAKAANATAITQVFDVESAQRAEGAGIDVVVARGLEGGGHGAPRTSRDELLAAVVEAVEVPVLAAGAIASRADVLAAIAAGAAGVWVGTAFAACSEALTTVGQRAAMIAATGDDTVLTRSVDLAMGYPWPAQFPSRVIANDFLRQWQGRDGEIADDMPAQVELREAMAADNTQTAPVDAGTGVGAITEVQTAAQVVSALWV